MIRALRPTGALYGNYPSERSRPAPVLAVPRGRCVKCKGAPKPCAFCEHDWRVRRCRCGIGHVDMPHAADCPRYDDEDHGHGQ